MGTRGVSGAPWRSSTSDPEEAFGGRAALTGSAQNVPRRRLLKSWRASMASASGLVMIIRRKVEPA